MGKRSFDALRTMTAEYGGDYGLNHSLRVMELVKRISQGRPYNQDVITFCAYVHDYGAYPKYMQAGKDHVLRSMEILPQYMDRFSFTDEEQKLILETVSGHHSPAVLQSLEAILFRDADALDFLGLIGIARDFMRAGKDFEKAVESIRRHREQLPNLLHEDEARQLAQTRIIEMDYFFEQLQTEHFGLLP